MIIPMLKRLVEVLDVYNGVFEDIIDLALPHLLQPDHLPHVLLVIDEC